MAHENLKRTHVVESSSDRAFGMVFAGVFLLVAAWPLLYGGELRTWAIAISLALFFIARFRPSFLQHANLAWMKLGLLLGLVVSPIALAVLYYGVITPIGTVMRLGKKDVLRRGLESELTSYWVPREPPGPPSGSMTNQF